MSLREAQRRSNLGHGYALVTQLASTLRSSQRHLPVHYCPSIGPIFRSACFSASNFLSRSRKSSSGPRSPQSK